MRGTDNQNLCPPIMGCYTHWTFWGQFLGEFGSVAFAIAPLYSTFLHQDDGVSCHPACLLMLHCLLSRRVVNGSI